MYILHYRIKMNETKFSGRWCSSNISSAGLSVDVCWPLWIPSPTTPHSELWGKKTCICLHKRPTPHYKATSMVRAQGLSNNSDQCSSSTHSKYLYTYDCTEPLPMKGLMASRVNHQTAPSASFELSHWTDCGPLSTHYMILIYCHLLFITYCIHYWQTIQSLY